MDGGSLVGVVLVAIPLCQVQNCDADLRHKNVRYTMILRSTPVMREPANPPTSFRPVVDECYGDITPFIEVR
jgi:hypothetical protein